MKTPNDELEQFAAMSEAEGYLGQCASEEPVLRPLRSYPVRTPFGPEERKALHAFWRREQYLADRNWRIATSIAGLLVLGSLGYLFAVMWMAQ